MNRAYWENLADTYEDHIFSVLRRDHGGRLKTLVEEFGDRSLTAADLGCGPGQITPLLATHFGQVHACDLSQGLLDHAQAECAEFRNVDFHRYDLSTGMRPPFSPADFVICVNVIITADLARRERLWDRITSLVGVGGILVLVLPSHESALYTNFRRLDWHLKAGLKADEAIDLSLPRNGNGNVSRLEHGVRGIEGVDTKHYLREEIMVQLNQSGLEVEEIEQLSYDWDIEFPDPPEWMGSPFPWNWLAVARRVS